MPNMKTGPLPKRHAQSGVALMAVLFMIAVMAAAIGTIYSVTMTEGRLMRHSVNRARATAYGDGVVQFLFDQWRMVSSSTQDATQRKYGFTATELISASTATPPLALPLVAPNSSQLPAPDGVSLVSWSVTPVDPMLKPLANSSTRAIQETGTFSRMRVRTYYMCQVKVAYGIDTVVLKRPFIRIGRNIFDNFLFSTQPITEIHPGAAMYVNGTVYAGGDLYTGTSNLNFLQDVTYTGNWSIAYAPGDPHASTPSSPSWPSNNPPHIGAQQKLLDTPISSLDPHFTNGTIADDTDSDGNLNNDGYHEIVEEHVSTGTTGPDPLQTDASGGSERMADNADYRIYIDASNSVTIYKGASTSAMTSTSNPTEYAALMGAITTNTTLSDGREGDNVRLVNVDVGKLATAVNLAASTYDSVGNNDGLLIYIKDTSAGSSVTTAGYSGYSVSQQTAGYYKASGGTSVTSTSKRGIRLINGGTLPDAGLSIATPNPVYIQGDYNSGATTNYGTINNSTSTTGKALTVTNQPASDGSGAYPSGTSSPVETSGTYTKKMSAIIADAVSILSNSWSDANSTATLTGGSRNPSNTTVNTAIVAGNVPTTSSAYSGGVENFPRLLENWNGSTYLTIHGSFGMLYDSEQATSPWKATGNYYNAPSRRWFFDTSLQDKNPPGFPLAYTYSMGGWAVMNKDH